MPESTDTAVAPAKGAIAPISTLTLIKGALKIMAWTKAKTAVVVVAAVIVVTGTTTLVVRQQQGHHQPRPLPAPRPVAAGQTEFPRQTWHFAGYSNPESAALSIIWACGNSDGHTFRNSLSPAQQKQIAGKPDSAIITAQQRVHFARVTGFRILDKQVLSENEVALRGYAEGLNATQTISFVRIGNEWKVNSVVDN